jgi:hypothetical protein
MININKTNQLQVEDRLADATKAMILGQEGEEEDDDAGKKTLTEKLVSLFLLLLKALRIIYFSPGQLTNLHFIISNEAVFY